MGVDFKDIDVVWVSYHEEKGIDHRGYWDHGIVEEWLKDCRHHLDFKGVRAGVVVVPARVHSMDTDQLNRDLAELDWCVLILTGDEESDFPWREIAHPHIKIWVMHPRVGLHDEATKLPNGYRPTTLQLLKETGPQERDQDWFFSGQVNHPRRQQCVEVLRNMPGGSLHETDGFGKEALAYPEYLAQMARSKIVLCPSGIETPDSFRLYEALEAGCLPVVDAYATNNPVRGYWQYLFGEVPFPIISEWSLLPELMPQLLKEWPENANKVFAWWINYKRKLKAELEEQIWTLSRY